MPTKQSAFFKGNVRKQINDSGKAGVRNSYLFTHEFTEAVATTDVLELFPIPPGAQILDFAVTPVNLAGVTLTAGVMSGESGDPVTVRTCGTELLNAAAAAAPAASTLAAVAGIVPDSGQARSIGFVPGANVPLDATKKLIVRVDFTMP